MIFFNPQPYYPNRKQSRSAIVGTLEAPVRVKRDIIRIILIQKKHHRANRSDRLIHQPRKER